MHLSRVKWRCICQSKVNLGLLRCNEGAFVEGEVNLS